MKRMKNKIDKKFSQSLLDNEFLKESYIENRDMFQHYINYSQDMRSRYERNESQ